MSYGLSMLNLGTASLPVGCVQQGRRPRRFPQDSFVHVLICSFGLLLCCILSKSVCEWLCVALLHLINHGLGLDLSMLVCLCCSVASYKSSAWTDDETKRNSELCNESRSSLTKVWHCRVFSSVIVGGLRSSSGQAIVDRRCPGTASGGALQSPYNTWLLIMCAPLQCLHPYNLCSFNVNCWSR